MGKVVDLYIRVSTDEQADKGYSQRDQEERLRRYCENNNLLIRYVIFEDHSAKSFKRPEWIKYLNTLKTKQNKDKSDLVLFTKWDRFSRNAADAYQMISRLKRLGVEPQAIEQPLDMEIPESKIMLAFYLASPEVENDRRALNIIRGMRRAKNEGRYLGPAPVGYINKVTEDGHKYIAVFEPQAKLIKWVFKEIAKGMLPADEIRRQAHAKGLKCGKTHFWTVIRHPVYCGKIFIPAFKDEPAKLVLGTHQPIVSEKLFYDVQDILDGRKRKVRVKAKKTAPEHLPLRGFLKCPKCTRMATGSGSKGRNRIFYYYHCLTPCRWRHRADSINALFEQELDKFRLRPGFEDLYKDVFRDAYKLRVGNITDERQQTIQEIEKINQRISKARNLLLADSIDASDYREIKSECDHNLVRLEAKLTDISASTSRKTNFEKLLELALKNLSQLSNDYKEGTIERKRQIIGSIFPEKINFEENEFRTARVNEAANLIYLTNKELTKNRKGDIKSDLSGPVVCTGGRTPGRLEEDLAKIATIDEMPAENVNRQEPRQKADHELLRSQRKGTSRKTKRPKI